MATGHIRPRKMKDGTTSYQLIVETEVDPSTGKRSRTYKTVHGSKRVATAELRKLIDEVEHGGIVMESSMKVSDWMDQWISLYVVNIESTTRASYEEKIRNYIKPHLGHISVKALNTSAVQSWVNMLSQEKKLAPKTIRNAFLNLKAALDKAVVLRMIPVNPCTGVVLPKAVKYQGEFYDREEIAVALKAAEGTDMYLILLLEFSVGLRRGELLALRWEHVDFENKVIHIRENRVIANGKVEIKAPKSSAGVRTIPIGDNLVKALKKARNDYLLAKRTQGLGFTDSDLIICQPNGKPFRPESVTQKWERFVASNGLKPIRFHDLRHSAATALLEAGADIKTVQQRLGHADASVTMNVYAHSTKAMNEKAAQKIDEIVFGEAVND